jgi:hypothetical protein
MGVTNIGRGEIEDLFESGRKFLQRVPRKRITLSRFDIFFATPRALCLRDLFGQATVPLESSLIDQKVESRSCSAEHETRSEDLLK